jgi:phosphatidate cytidylyltransferase
LHNLDNYISVILILATILALFVEMLRLKERPIANTAVTIFGIIYVGLFISVLIGIREHELMQDSTMRGLFVIILFFAVWICDSMAFLFGTRFGKHKLFPRVSPKKSVEGAIAGFLGSFLFWILMYSFQILPGMELLDIGILAILTGIFGQVGDLLESWLKRSADVKDSSSLLPGHGGVLDRFDSMMIVAPLTYILIHINFI